MAPGVSATRTRRSRRVAVLTEHRAPDDHELQYRVARGADLAYASSSTSRPLSGSRRATAPTTSVSSPRPTRRRNAPARAGENSAGIEGFVEHDDVRGVELGGDRVRHRDHAGREVSAEHALDAQRGAGLHDDLAPRARRAAAARAAPRPSRTSVWSELECTTSTWSFGRAAASRADRDRPAGDIGRPLAGAVAGGRGGASGRRAGSRRPPRTRPRAVTGPGRRCGSRTRQVGGSARAGGAPGRSHRARRPVARRGS